MPTKIKFLVTIDRGTGETSVKELVPPKRDAYGRFEGERKATFKARVCKFAAICPLAVFKK